MGYNMKTVAIIQARMGSTRFPNKVMSLICGKPMIELLLSRLDKSKHIDERILATSDNKNNDFLCDFVIGLGCSVYRGSEQDVLDRYYQAAKKMKAKVVVRITGDCPLIDPEIVDQIIEVFKKDKLDYVSNTIIPTYPDGLDVEVFSFAALEKAWHKAKNKEEREHVTPYLKNSDQFLRKNIDYKDDHSAKRWTVDEPEDLVVIKKICEYFAPNIYFKWQDILNLYVTNPEYFSFNEKFIRNEGMNINTGQKLWKRAKKVIPGGNMLLSKRPEMFLPDLWPAYFSKAKGCEVWDLDSNKYIDMSIMGIGTNILGYGHPDVDDAVREAINKGNMSTFNCPEEVYLAEKLIEIHPWAEMARFARTGGEANAVAIRIARAATGKDKVAICGYHGWHDWYLAANLPDDKNLSNHLLPGLEPKGVPEFLKGGTLTFNYNKIEELEELIKNNSIAAICMEVMRNMPPENRFLEKVRKIATENNIVLIFDECTSGFRQTLGGLHKLYGVEPDMAMFGKALGNGYAITAIIGKRMIMESAQSTFISSTFWTERIGYVSALKTLEVMEREKSWDTITRTGNIIAKQWELLAKKYNLPIHISGLPAMIGFSFPFTNMLKYKTFITQEMLKKGLLAATSVYVCIDHTEEVLNTYFAALEPVFAIISDCESSKYNIDLLLNGAVCHAGFKRLN
jgi:glutamate-1-semialdehyde 2,1-aminomutase